MTSSPQSAVLDRRTVAVVIPALNEALRIRDVVESALAHADTVILIDDGSDDGTSDCIADLPVIVVRHPQRKGKGAALRAGFREALARGSLAVITMDGDGQHAGSDIPRMIFAANHHPDWIVIGARLRKRANQPTYRRLANEFGDWGIAWGTGYQIADSQSGQRLYPASVCALTDIPGEDFVFEAQIVMSAAQRLGTRCVSIPIEARYNDIHGAPTFRPSHFRPLRDLWRITSHIVAQCVRRGSLWQVHRLAKANPPVIHDPSGEFGIASADQHQVPANADDR